jgi:threonine synthase
MKRSAFGVRCGPKGTTFPAARIGRQSERMTSLYSQVPSAFFSCSSCGRSFPEEGFPYRCDTCGGHYDFSNPLSYERPDPGMHERGIKRFRATFPLNAEAPFISLGEGDTPLASVENEGRSLFLKCEHANPTGSFKDRGTAVLISALSAQGVKAALEDSSGNAGASFAAYAARAGMQATVYVPAYTSGPKQAQIQAYGAQIVRVPGPRSATSEAVQQEAARGIVYASHTYLPYGIAGMATIAYELVEQLGCPPGAVLTPVGQGTLFLGLYRGFLALREAGLIERLPRLVGVQAQVCAPLWAVFHGGAAGLAWVQEGSTLAEGIRILHPLRGDQILKAVDDCGGMMLAVDEDEILPARDELAGHGFYVEPTSAVVWAGLRQCLPQLEDPVVLVLTGHGLKSAVQS